MNLHEERQNQFSVQMGAIWQNRKVISVDTVAHAVADFAIRPTLISHGDSQVLAFYDAERRLTVANRSVRGLNWSFRKADSFVEWDSHNYIDLGFDPSGLLHIAGNMHASPLQYWTTDVTGSSDQMSKIQVLSDKSKENKVTYPRFLRDREGSLLFTYRDGTSGDGDFMCLRWDDDRQKYQQISKHPLIEGAGKRNAYIDTNSPILGPDGAWHLLWVWRDSPQAESTHTVNYACSYDLVHWRNGSGRDIPGPITFTGDTIIDPVPPGQGLINNNVRLGFLPNGSPIAIYHKSSSTKYQQLWAATHNGKTWVRRQLTDWSYHWDFSGEGSLDFRIEVGAPKTSSSGITLDVRRDHEVETYFIDEDLSIISTSEAAPWSPLRRVPAGDGLFQRVTQEHRWTPNDASSEWFVSHRSVAEQRDRRPEGTHISAQPLVVAGTDLS